MNLKKNIYRLMWIIISFFETLYWFIKRQNLLTNYKSLGVNTFISRGCYFSGNIFIGDDIYIGQRCFYS